MEAGSQEKREERTELSLCCAVLSCSVLSDSLWPHIDCRLPGSSLHGILQEIILGWVATPSSRGSFQSRDQTQDSHKHYGQIIFHLGHQGSPWILELVAYPFSRGSSQPRNRTGVSCIAGRFFTRWGMKPRLCHCRRNKENPAVLCFLTGKRNIADVSEWVQAIHKSTGTLETDYKHSESSMWQVHKEMREDTLLHACFPPPCLLFSSTPYRLTQMVTCLWFA